MRKSRLAGFRMLLAALAAFAIVFSGVPAFAAPASHSQYQSAIAANAGHCPSPKECDRCPEVCDSAGCAATCGAKANSAQTWKTGYSTSELTFAAADYLSYRRPIEPDRRPPRS